MCVLVCCWDILDLRCNYRILDFRLMCAVQWAPSSGQRPHYLQPGPLQRPSLTLWPDLWSCPFRWVAWRLFIMTCYLGFISKTWLDTLDWRGPRTGPGSRPYAFTSSSSYCSSSSVSSRRKHCVRLCYSAKVTSRLFFFVCVFSGCECEFRSGFKLTHTQTTTTTETTRIHPSHGVKSSIRPERLREKVL